MKRIAIASLLGLACVTATARATVTFEYLFGGGGYPIAITPDGQVVTGNGPNWGEFRWTQSGGWVDLGMWPTPSPGGKPGISDDGTRIAGTILGADSTYSTAGMWTLGSGWQQIMPPGGPPDMRNLDRNYATVYGLSGDGSTVVGLYWRTVGRGHAFRWTQAGGGVDLGSVLPGHASRANNVNRDGSVVVGWDEGITGQWRPAAWVNGVESLLSDTSLANGNGAGEAGGANPAGTIVVGFQMNPATTIREPAKWTRTLSTWSPTQFLGALPGTNPQGYGINYAHSVTADGQMVVGYCSFDGSPYYTTGFVWTPQTGTIDVVTWLNNNGVYVDPSFYIQDLSAITPDGRYLLGYGQDLFAPYTRRAFRIYNSSPTAVEATPRSTGLVLAAPSPNPSCAATRLSFTLPAPSEVDLSVFDTGGRRIATPVHGAFDGGIHSFGWDGRDNHGELVNPGLYWARLTTPSGSVTQRVVRVR